MPMPDPIGIATKPESTKSKKPIGLNDKATEPLRIGSKPSKRKSLMDQILHAAVAKDAYLKVRLRFSISMTLQTLSPN